METYPWRLLNTGHHDGFYNMALDEAILESVSGGQSLPTLRLYGWSPAAVSVGYFQGLREEVDPEACKRHGVDVVRRISGGGAVFHQAELTYSIFIPMGHPLGDVDIGESYTRLCGGIIRGLEILGISARFVPINDIIAGDRKVSGNAQTRRQGCILQHGTVLLENNVDLMFELLKVPREKLRGKLIDDVKKRVTSLRTLLGRAIPFDQAAEALAEGFRRALGLRFSAPSSPEPGEEERARKLAADKFASPQWLYKR
ncbi:MAG: lipoate--protein ligase family protein [Treponema sp.]|jgi:lipoate-protein ligase A|nr:lipoate--protein ligase family protein [Treponema sp.]